MPIAQTLNTLNANAILPANNTIWLRMTKSGPFYSTFYSLDGTTWVPVWTTGATLKNLKAGVFAYNRTGTTCADATTTSLVAGAGATAGAGSEPGLRANPYPSIAGTASY